VFDDRVHCREIPIRRASATLRAADACQRSVGLALHAYKALVVAIILMLRSRACQSYADQPARSRRPHAACQQVGAVSRPWGWAFQSGGFLGLLRKCSVTRR
jgi:hypothetical protein